MKICMVTMHACIRVFKYTWALKAAHPDWEIYLMADRESMGWNIYKNMSKYLSKEMFQDQVKMYDKFIDVFHVHNEPDNLVTWVREVSDKPIIYDCHDLQSLRTLEDPDVDELAAFELSDYVIHVGSNIAKHAEAIHGKHDHSIIKSWVNKDFFVKEPVEPCWDAFCYEGGITDYDQDHAGLMSYRFYVPFVAHMKNQNYIVNLYSAAKDPLPKHAQAGATINFNIPYPELFRAMQINALGFVGSCIKVPIMMDAVPNKLFEYMAAGVTPIFHWCDAAYDQVKDYGIGVKLKNIENAREEIGSVKKLRRKTLKERWNFVFENQLPEIEKIYERVLS